MSTNLLFNNYDLLMRSTCIEVETEPGARSAQDGRKDSGFSGFTKFGIAILARFPRLCALSFCIVG